MIKLLLGGLEGEKKVLVKWKNYESETFIAICSEMEEINYKINKKTRYEIILIN